MSKGSAAQNIVDVLPASICLPTAWAILRVEFSEMGFRVVKVQKYLKSIMSRKPANASVCMIEIALTSISKYCIDFRAHPFYLLLNLSLPLRMFPRSFELDTPRLTRNTSVFPYFSEKGGFLYSYRRALPVPLVRNNILNVLLSIHSFYVGL